MSLPFYIDPTYAAKKIPINQQWFRTVMNHPLFQRLRNIGQTSCSDHLFITHRHSRFEHSLGTSYLAKIACENFDVDESLKDKVIFSGMCHDLGHGPFSHSLEYYVLPKLNVHNFCHEDYSVKIATEIYKDLKYPNFDIEDLAEILNNGGKNLDNEIFHLISNKSFGVDVDRADYMLRDSFLLGVDLNLEVEKLFGSMVLEKNINNKAYALALKAEAVPLFHKFIETRYMMFEQLYYQPLATGRNLLVARLLFEADAFTHLSQKLINFDEFVHLDDHILKEATKYKNKNPQLDKTIQMIEHNQGYHFCVEFKIVDEHTSSKKPKDMDLYSHKLKEEILGKDSDIIDDVEIHFVRIDSFKDVDYDNILIKDGTEIIKLPEYLAKNGLSPLKQKIYQRFRIYVLSEEMIEPVLDKFRGYAESHAESVKDINYDPSIYDIFKATEKLMSN